MERALLLNPNDTDVLVHASLCRAYLGDGASSLELARKAMRLNPAFPPWYAAPAGLALFVLGRDTDAVLTRVLGLRRADVQRLRQTGVL